MKRGKSDVEAPSSGNPSNIRLEAVNPLWLNVSAEDRYLLLEDPETGDVLMPLIYMKAILEANYSRKLASLKNRLVMVPKGSALAKQEGLLYWQWAFESPHSVKVVVRKELGEENTPQGHLRLVILPIVYNAMSQKPELRQTLLFRALHRAMKASSYYQLLRLPPSDVLAELDAEDEEAGEGSSEAGQASAVPALFQGPRTVEASALKYMFMFRDQEELEASKRMRSGNTPGQEEGSLAVKEMLAAASQYQLPQSSGATQTAPLTAGAGFGSSGAQEAASPQFGLDAGAGQHQQQQQQAATGRGGSLGIATIPKQAPQQQPYRGGRQQQQGQQHGGGGGAGLPATASLQQLINQMQQQQAAAEQNQHRHHNHRHHQPPAFGQGAEGGGALDGMVRQYSQRIQQLEEELAFVKRCLVQLYGALVPGASSLLGGGLGPGQGSDVLSDQLLQVLPGVLRQSMTAQQQTKQQQQSQAKLLQRGGGGSGGGFGQQWLGIGSRYPSASTFGGQPHLTLPGPGRSYSIQTPQGSLQQLLQSLQQQQSLAPAAAEPANPFGGPPPPPAMPRDCWPPQRQLSMSAQQQGGRATAAAAAAVAAAAQQQQQQGQDARRSSAFHSFPSGDGPSPLAAEAAALLRDHLSASLQLPEAAPPAASGGGGSGSSPAKDERGLHRPVAMHLPSGKAQEAAADKGGGQQQQQQQQQSPGGSPTGGSGSQRQPTGALASPRPPQRGGAEGAAEAGGDRAAPASDSKKAADAAAPQGGGRRASPFGRPPEASGGLAAGLPLGSSQFSEPLGSLDALVQQLTDGMGAGSSGLSSGSLIAELLSQLSSGPTKAQADSALPGFGSFLLQPSQEMQQVQRQGGTPGSQARGAGAGHGGRSPATTADKQGPSAPGGSGGGSGGGEAAVSMSAVQELAQQLASLAQAAPPHPFMK